LNTSKKKFIPPPERIHVLCEEDLDLAPKRILMLEDDKDLAALLECFLHTNSFQVTTVSNGVQGLRKIMESDFDVILCDLVMPNLPGDMFYLAVERTKPRLCKRFLFMTGHVADPKWDSFIRKVDGVILRKPFELHELMERVTSVLKKA
jgi:DNA-binding response OmpR family regulator